MRIKPSSSLLHRKTFPLLHYHIQLCHNIVLNYLDITQTIMLFLN